MLKNNKGSILVPIIFLIIIVVGGIFLYNVYNVQTNKGIVVCKQHNMSFSYLTDYPGVRCLDDSGQLLLYSRDSIK